MDIVYTDVLIIGGGLAGLRVGIGAKRRGHATGLQRELGEVDAVATVERQDQFEIDRLGERARVGVDGPIPLVAELGLAVLTLLAGTWRSRRPATGEDDGRQQ